MATQTIPIESSSGAQDHEYTSAVFSGRDSQWRRCERALLNRGAPLPLPHRSAWLEVGAGQPLFIAIHDTRGECVFGFAARIHATRALPYHRIMRVRRFGGWGKAEARAAGVRALVEAARSYGRLLRLHLEVFSRDADTRSAIRNACAAAGLCRAKGMRSYAETVIIDLSPDIGNVFADLHATGRRHVRAVDKNPVEVRVIRDHSFASRMSDLTRETMNRTDGSYRAQDWVSIIDFSRAHPALARVVGLFRTDASGPEALLAFAIGYAHGDHVEYGTAASTRDTALNMPLAYGIAWDLIRWGKSVGATWFDFGGVTRGTHGSADDPRGGISDFKRYFSRDVARVAEEWILEPHPIRAAAARVTSSTAKLLRS